MPEPTNPTPGPSITPHPHITPHRVPAPHARPHLTPQIVHAIGAKFQAAAQEHGMHADDIALILSILARINGQA